MKKLSIFTIILFALGLYMVPVAFATGTAGYSDSKDKKSNQSAYQKDQKNRTENQQAQQGQNFQQQKQSLVLLENLNGAEVLNPQGENIGEFEHVLVDVETGQIAFITLDSGGILGMGEESYIVPFNALKNDMPQRTDGTLGVTQMRFTLNKSKDQLKRVPEGDIEEALSQEDQSREIHEYYGVSPYWEDNQRQQNRQDGTQRQMMQDEKQDHMMNNKDQKKNQKKY